MWHSLKTIRNLYQINIFKPLPSCRSTYDSGDVISPGTLKPLLKQLMEAILDPTKPELPDVEYISTGFRDLLKSGFG